MPGSLTVEATVGEIARRTGSPVHRIEYIIRSRKFRPARIAGNCRIFSDEAVQRIAAELERINARKGGA
jgi:hypothetical protein